MLAKRILLAAAATLATLLAVELVLGIVGGVEPAPPIYPGERTPAGGPGVDPRIGWKLPPGRSIVETTGEYSVSYRSNRQGFRSRRDFERPTRRRRLVFLGDSYTMGSGVEDRETFAHLVSERLRRTRAYNLGIGGFGVDQMWLTLRHYGLPLDPDLVVLSFVRADLHRALSAYRLGYDWLAKPVFRLDGGELVPITAENRPPALWRFLQRHSRLLELTRRIEHSLARRFPVGYTWRLHRALFERIRDDCAAAGVPLVVVHIPVNRLHPILHLESEFADMGIPLLDLTDHLPEDAQTLFYPIDRHLNAEGHRFVAERIAEFLIAGGHAAPAARAAPSPRARERSPSGTRRRPREAPRTPPRS